MLPETLLSIFVGIGLSAACGFRIFVPLLVMSIASLSGYLTLAPGFEWIASVPALVAFAIATVLEIAGYYIPWLDHLLDIVASPAAVIAGILVTASAVTGMSPFLRWAFAIIAGGGVAGTIQVITSMTRLTSGATTGGAANPLVSTAEGAGSMILSILAVLVPMATIVLVAAILLLALGPGRRLLRRRSPRNRKTSQDTEERG